jgi:hypothetical protein
MLEQVVILLLKLYKNDYKSSLSKLHIINVIQYSISYTNLYSRCL